MKGKPIFDTAKWPANVKLEHLKSYTYNSLKFKTKQVSFTAVCGAQELVDGLTLISQK